MATMSSEAETQHPAAPTLSTAHPKPGATCSGLGSCGPGDGLWSLMLLRRTRYGGSKCYRGWRSSSARSQYVADHNQIDYPRGRGAPCNYSRMTRTARVGGRMRDWRVLPKARPNSAGPTAGHGSHPTTCGDPMGVDHNIPTLLCREKGQRVLTTRAQESKLRKDSVEEDKENHGEGTQVSSPLHIGTTATSITDADAQKTLNHRTTKRQGGRSTS
ncbi:hypothetical protein HPG69_018572 [Diceros bicornis minor]|uniref:Uncharacterized protein n=1 Tax=Diceros bicornis minor TaxID=77932 RepID=A0A7J7EZD2_DICBM|nr:hypothetical protein HPG69_018572 [Diceros bicornis minor]